MTEEVTVVATHQVNGVLLVVKKLDLRVLPPWHCGYASFAEDPLPRTSGYDGIAEYVPVHGGITAVDEEDGRTVYGFDCAHSGDEGDPRLQDTEWLLGECDSMARAIQAAAPFEDRFEDAEDEDKDAVGNEYLETLRRDHGFEFNVKDDLGMGYHINQLFGR